MGRVYNRYIPEETQYVPANSTEKSDFSGPGQRGGGPHPSAPHPNRTGGGGSTGFSSLLGGKEGILSILTGQSGGKGVTSALKSLKLGDWDSGDLLLLLIVLLLLSEGDDLELVIALGLALMMGLGDGKKDSGT